QLRAFAWTNGLEITGEHPNRLLLDVRGTVADLENALRVTMRLYNHPTEARKFYAPDGDPSVDLAIPLMGISGLNNYWLPRPRVRVKPWGSGSSGPLTQPKPNSGSGPSGTYMGIDFRAAYVPGSSLTGSGQ